MTSAVANPDTMAGDDTPQPGSENATDATDAPTGAPTATPTATPTDNNPYMQTTGQEATNAEGEAMNSGASWDTTNSINREAGFGRDTGMPPVKSNCGYTGTDGEESDGAGCIKMSGVLSL